MGQAKYCQLYYFVLPAAISGVDYSSDPTVMVLFNNGDNLTSCIDIDIISNAVFEGDEQFIVDIDSSSFPLTISSPSSTTVVIDDSQGIYHLLLPLCVLNETGSHDRH